MTEFFAVEKECVYDELFRVIVYEFDYEFPAVCVTGRCQVCLFRQRSAI